MKRSWRLNDEMKTEALGAAAPLLTVLVLISTHMGAATGSE